MKLAEMAVLDMECEEKVWKQWNECSFKKSNFHLKTSHMIIHYDFSVVLDEFRIAGNPKQSWSPEDSVP